MNKRILILAMAGFILLLTACFGRTSGDSSRSEIMEVFATSTVESIQVNQGRILPPYGLKVMADAASLTLRVSTSKDNAADRLADVQNAISHISALASKSETVTLENVSINQVGGSSVGRGTPAPHVQNLDTSSAILKLTTDLANHNHSLLESVTAFNDFLKSISLPETITVRVLSVETEIKNPEMYREQLIAKVYQELKAVEEEYGPSVKYEVTGLHGMPLLIRLTDTEYYIYIEPNIVVKEF